MPEKRRIKRKWNNLISFCEGSFFYLIDIILIIRVNRNLKQINMRRNGIQLRSYNIFHPMKKSSKKQVPPPLSILKQPIMPSFAFSGVQQILRQHKMENKESRQVMIVCPNCEFHFKVELKPSKYDDHGHYSQQASPKQYSEFIEEEYSLISNNEREGKSFMNSPTLMKKSNLDVVEILNSHELSGIDKLKKLNEFSQYQKSTLKASRQLRTPRAFKDSIQRYQQIHQSFDKSSSFRNFPQIEKTDKEINKFTERFQPSPRESPIKSEQQKYSLKEELSKGSRIDSPVNNKQLSNAQRLQIQKIMINYCLFVSVFKHLRTWLSSNQLLKNLPSYLKLMISQCYEITILSQK